MPEKDNSRDSSILNLFSALVDRVSESSSGGDSDGSLLDLPVSVAKEFFERQAAGGLSLISFSENVDDYLAVKDQVMELTLGFGRVQALAGTKVYFSIDGDKVGDAEVGPERKARLQYVPRKAGCFPITCTIVSRSGKDVSDARTKRDVLIQVFDRKPVVCVDANLLFHKKRKMKKELDAFSSRGFDIVYIDFGDKDRIEDIRKIRRHRDLPEGAVVPLTARIRGFESFDVDFKQSFFGLTIERLRARGVPVVALLAEMEVDRDYSFPDVKLIDPASQLKESSFENLSVNARQFLARRKKAWTGNRNTLEWRINELVEGKWSLNNHCTVQFDNRLARQEIFKAIDQASKRVDLQFYIFKESRFAHELGVHLVQAARRGVKVRLMVDALWSGERFLGTWNTFLKRMEKIDRIHIVAADPVRLADEWDAMRLRQRDHRKIIVVDGHTAFVGGRNAADEYYYDWSEVPIADWTTAENIPWLDAHVRVEGPAVRQLQLLFNRTWTRNGGKYFAPLRPAGARRQNSTSDSRIKLVVHEGTRDANGLAAYEALISGARKKLILVNDFPVLDDIAEMLIQAVRRGVKVSFLTGSVLARRADGSFFEGGRHRELFEYVVKSRLGVLVDAGVEVFNFQTPALDNIAVEGDRIRPYVHAKLVTADSRFVSIGSANLDVTASYWEREANLLIDDPKVVKSIDRKLQAMIRNGVRLDTHSPEWTREAPQREIVSRLWPDSFLT